ncbi:unnamed protein product [Acanthosepion pharaonis]|uniref:Uncharacterized protein n=1 Tax=Acanthosepion pharaonis TaxID=158019 RepID=A0A812DNY9_ACAPH|nr:unnamed protein product [Sepia pharaonis]
MPSFAVRRAEQWSWVVPEQFPRRPSFTVAGPRMPLEGNRSNTLPRRSKPLGSLPRRICLCFRCNLYRSPYIVKAHRGNGFPLVRRVFVCFPWAVSSFPSRCDFLVFPLSLGEKPGLRWFERLCLLRRNCSPFGVFRGPVWPAPPFFAFTGKSRRRLFFPFSFLPREKGPPAPCIPPPSQSPAFLWGAPPSPTVKMFGGFYPAPGSPLFFLGRTPPLPGTPGFTFPQNFWAEISPALSFPPFLLPGKTRGPLKTPFYRVSAPLPSLAPVRRGGPAWVFPRPRSPRPPGGSRGPPLRVFPLFSHSGFPANLSPWSKFWGALPFPGAFAGGSRSLFSWRPAGTTLGKSSFRARRFALRCAPTSFGSWKSLWGREPAFFPFPGGPPPPPRPKPQGKKFLNKAGVPPRRRLPRVGKTAPAAPQKLAGASSPRSSLSLPLAATGPGSGCPPVSLFRPGLIPPGGRGRPPGTRPKPRPFPPGRGSPGPFSRRRLWGATVGSKGRERGTGERKRTPKGNAARFPRTGGGKKRGGPGPRRGGHFSFGPRGRCAARGFAGLNWFFLKAGALLSFPPGAGPLRFLVVALPGPFCGVSGGVAKGRRAFPPPRPPGYCRCSPRRPPFPPSPSLARPFPAGTGPFSGGQPLPFWGVSGGAFEKIDLNG